MTTQQTIHGMQLYHAIFELEDRAVANSRTVERLVTAALAGGAVLLSGPAGIGKSHAAAAVATVFGVPCRTVVAPQHLTEIPEEEGLEILIVEDIDCAPASVQNDLAESLGERSNGLVVGTVTTGGSPPSGAAPQLSRRMRDAALMFVDVPYPDPAQERMAVHRSMTPTRTVDRILNATDLRTLRAAASQIVVDDAVVDYAVRLVNATRQPQAFGLDNLTGLMGGVSPRASIALVGAARSIALVRGRQAVAAQDVYDVAYEVLVHRIEPTPSSVAHGIGSADILVELLTRVPAATG